MEFWNSLLTEKSWDILVELNKKPFGFIVIGGWAAYLWTKLHKSKDLDIALTDLRQLEYLKENYNLKKNDNLKKYEISFEEIDVDIYAPFFSKLAIPVEDLKNYSTKIENFNVVIPEALLILKQGAEIDREKSVKGGKDRIDIMTLLCFTDINFKKYLELLKKYKIEHFKYRLTEIIKNFKDMQYLELNPRQLKLKKTKILDELKRN
ncbi:MAG: hypothetical protein Q7J54_05090 [Candidatus Woesearchaeota archaeon]|nr:hypothetical protein [Candidatus Woesearchaeota archaeon]